MTLRLLAVSLGLAAALGLASIAPAQEKDKEKDTAKPESKGESASDAPKSKTDAIKKPKIEKATFAAGCFWSVEAVFERVPGVKSVTSGFSGGSVPNPSYQLVCTGETGHAEAVQIEYDPSLVSYEKLLTVFWKVHDPTTLNSQGDDFGTQYRSVIFFHTEAQRKAALKSYQDLTARRAFREPIVTDLAAAAPFFPAEPYHQDYYNNHRDSNYSFMYIDPKLKKMKATILKKEKEKETAAASHDEASPKPDPAPPSRPRPARPRN
jgi:peptide-methionine (S)-S-oxide reductase